MKKAILFSLFTTFFSFSFAQEKTPTIKWMTWEEAVAQHTIDLANYSKATGKDKVPPKKMYIDFYTSWCGWCKRMDQTTFKDPAIVQFMNKYFYAVKFDAERSKALTFNNHEFVNPNPGKSRSTHQFAISILDRKLSYPSYVILDENLNRTVIYAGYKQVEDLLGILLYYGKNQHLPYLEQIKAQVKVAAQQKK